MKIIDGHPIEGKAWRALVLLTPGQKLDIPWVLGHHLGRANGQQGWLLLTFLQPAPSRHHKIIDYRF